MSAPPRRRLRPGILATLLAALLLALFLLSLRSGATGLHGLGESARALFSLAGLAEPLAEERQLVFHLRLRRTLVAAAVGAGLAYSGALLQGLFRNVLASPSVLGVSAGASLGATCAILLAGGAGGGVLAQRAAELAPILVLVLAFAGGFAAVGLVVAVASSGGRVSVPSLLLAGIAVNVSAAGFLTAIQALVLRGDRIELAKALFSWFFGEVRDPSRAGMWLVLGGVALAACAVPLVARELDLFAGGEEDAEGLGVDTARVKLLALGAASLAAAAAVAVAGQIAFVGLVVPHLLRLASGSSHRALLPLSLLGGAVFLLGADLARRLLPGGESIGPGVLMALLGGPFFLVLLLGTRKELQTW